MFFGRLFENDVFSSSVAASSSVLWLLAFLAVPGVMFSGSQLFAYAHLRHQPFEVIDRTLLQRETFHIDFVMGVAGLVTMMVWSSLTPDRRDAHVLGPLPITSRQQALGRLLALLTFFGLFIAPMAVPTGIAHPFVTVGAENITELPARILGHIIGAVLAGGFVFFLLVNVQLLLAAAFGPGAIKAATLPLQLVAMAGMIAGLISSGSIRTCCSSMRRTPAAASSGTRRRGSSASIDGWPATSARCSRCSRLGAHSRGSACSRSRS